jgi:hypothetical protein
VNSSNTVLAAKANDSCTNPNCKAKKRSTHTISNCYWLGGGKEEQFPLNFGQRNRANAATSGSLTSQLDHFVLSAWVSKFFGQSGIVINDPSDHPPMALTSKGFQSFQKGKVLTFMDSGASDTMFVSRDAFIEYKPIIPQNRDSAKVENGDFERVGKWNVVQWYQVDGKDCEITYTHALHMPTLNANLVSVSAMNKAGLTTIFANIKGTIQKADKTVVLTGQNVNRMYLLETVNNLPNFLVAMTLLSQPISLKKWHLHLAHCSPLTIQEMAKKDLVNRLIITEMTVSGKCEDCIMGCQTCWPFDGITEKNLALLDLIAFDLWRPSCVQSVRGKIYIMIIVDGRTSYKYGVYLPDKSDDTMIAVFDAFCIKAETATGRKICQMQTNQAYESKAWEEYCECHGIIIHEFTAPYFSAQNGLAEHGIRTTIDNTCTLLWDSGLGHAYWAQVAAYSINTQNIIPSHRHLGTIPTEAFLGKRQNVEYLHVFGSKCWKKIPAAQGGSKLNPQSTKCWFLEYAFGRKIYKVQEVGVTTLIPNEYQQSSNSSVSGSLVQGSKTTQNAYC